jgi:putative restriction endonuclease
MSSLEEYARIFAHLNRSPWRGAGAEASHGKAPYKPLLLMAVLDVFAEGLFPDGRVSLRPELVDVFERYWYRVMPFDQRPNIAMPFFHLKNDGDFWQLVATPGNERALEQASGVRSVRELERRVLYAQLAPDLVRCMIAPEGRAVLRDVLVRAYFTPPAQARLLKQAGVNADAFVYSEELLAPRIAAEALAEYAAKPAARDQGFRRVVTAYDHRCAMCGIRIQTADGHAAVQAAHIHRWSESHNDLPTNGLALCMLCHWSFDQGLLGADRDRTILVSPQLSAHGNIPGHLAQLASRPLFPPAEPRLAPEALNLRWHQQHVFRSW